MRVVKLTVFQLRQSVNVNIVFSSYIFDLVCTNEVFHWQATIMGPVGNFIYLNLCCHISRFDGKHS